jgi:hypothetical protein
MKLRLHHIEICVLDPVPVIKLLCDQLGLNLVGQRETNICTQYVLKLCKTAFVVTSRKGEVYYSNQNNINLPCDNQSLPLDENEDLTLFCCKQDQGEAHIDSVFNVAVEVKNLVNSINRMKRNGAKVLQDIKHLKGPDGVVQFAVIKSCCGNVVHTLIQKTDYNGWFLPGFNKLPNPIPSQDPNIQSHLQGITMSHFDHFTLACKVGETNEIIEWYESTFGMKRFITNRYIALHSHLF